MIVKVLLPRSPSASQRVVQMKARSAAFAVALFTLVSSSFAASALAAKVNLLSIGEVISAAPNGRAKLGLVRSTLEREVDAIDWRKSTKMKRYVVSVSVVSLDTQTTRDKVATTCELSTTVRNARSGSVVAIVNQRVRAENAAGYARAVEEGALKAAAEAAIRKIPSALTASTGG